LRAVPKSLHQRDNAQSPAVTPGDRQYPSSDAMPHAS
jgi:hypothetical protein